LRKLRLRDDIYRARGLSVKEQKEAVAVGSVAPGADQAAAAV
jgi:hypothetical protein